MGRLQVEDTPWLRAAEGPLGAASGGLDVDGTTFGTEALAEALAADGRAVLCRPGPGTTWRVCSAPPTETGGEGADPGPGAGEGRCGTPGRAPLQPGPLRMISRRPFLCVVGTHGGAEQTQAHLDAATRLANGWFVVGGGVTVSASLSLALPSPAPSAAPRPTPLPLPPVPPLPSPFPL